MRWLVVAFLTLALPVAAQSVAPEAAGATAPKASPAPKARPADLPDPEAQIPPDEPMADATGGDTANGVGTVHERLRESDDAYAACIADLIVLGAAFEEVAPVDDASVADCGIARPIAVREIAPGIALAPDATMRCDTARALAKWVTTIVRPAAGVLEDRGALIGLDHGSSYICRRRNNAPDGKISEHGFGNAIDIVGFRFSEGAPIRIEPRERDGTLAEAFQRAVRAGSCLYFTTVLGPGTDAAHADHLHLDVKARNGGFRLCQ